MLYPHSLRKLCANRAPLIERLEERTLLSLTLVPPTTNINITQMPGNQAEGSIVVDPSNPNHVFAMSNNAAAYGLAAAGSWDGGNTWLRHTIADGHDALNLALGDNSCAYDTHGNIFIAYVGSTGQTVEVATSNDNGQSFYKMATFKGNVDQPTITAGASSVWVTFANGGDLSPRAPISSIGQVGQFQRPQVAANGQCAYGDISIAPNGAVTIVYESPEDGQGPSTFRMVTDPDGLGRALFSPPLIVGTSNIGGLDIIPAQSTRSIDAEIGIAYDRSGGAFNGRLYMVYTDELPDESNNTDIMLKWSDNQGKTWTAPVRVNDDAGTNSQFLPRIAIDQTTGNIGLSWYDSRNDLGVAGSGSTNNIANDDAQYFAAVATPYTSSVTISPNIQVSLGTSNGLVSQNEIELGDYTGLAFNNGILYPEWADNSNSMSDNPDGALAGLDMYVAQVVVQSTAPAAVSAASTFSSTQIDSTRDASRRAPGYQSIPQIILL